MKPEEVAETEGCIVCGFNRKLHMHHIIAVMDYGADNIGNCVLLCMNHHWMIHHGTKEDKEFVKNEIFRRTGKLGQRIPEKNIKIIEEEIRMLCIADNYPGDNIDLGKNDSNWNYYKSALLARNPSSEQRHVIDRLIALKNGSYPSDNKVYKMKKRASQDWNEVLRDKEEDENGWTREELREMMLNS